MLGASSWRIKYTEQNRVKKGSLHPEDIFEPLNPAMPKLRICLQVFSYVRQ